MTSDTTGVPTAVCECALLCQETHPRPLCQFWRAIQFSSQAEPPEPEPEPQSEADRIWNITRNMA